MANEPCVANIQGLEQTRALVASLEAGLQFSRCIAGTMDVLKQLLASSPDDVKHTIALLIIAQQFEIDGAEASLRKMLPLVFSQDKGVCEAVERAFITIYIKESSSETALSLINLTLDATIGDLTSIEALVSKFTATGDISRSMISALWNYFTFNAVDVTPQRSRGALVILCMAAKSKPEILSTHLQSLMDIGLGRRASDDPLLARFTCIVFQRLSTDDRASLGSHHKIFSVLSSLIKGQGLSEEIWYSTVEQAINAVYILHPTPEQFSSALLIKLFQSLFGRCENKSDGSPPASGGKTCENAKDLGIGYAENSSKHPSNVMVFTLSRFLFALAHVALKHLVYIESCVRKLRKQRADKDKAVADAVADMQASEVPSSKSATDKSKNESINEELGMAASEDARIDVLLEKAESEIVGGETNQQFLIGTMAPIVAKICRNMTLMQQNPRLRSSAMLALCKLMAIDANFW
jgi:condensin complex subunit 1